MLSLVRGSGRDGRLNLWVILGIMALSVALGILNNLRVYEEQQIRLWGESGDDDLEERVDEESDIVH